jgi:hypothetical protein
LEKEDAMNVMKKLENIFSAVAFAEAGEHETARQILKENKEKGTAERKEASAGKPKKHEHATPTPSRA